MTIQPTSEFTIDGYSVPSESRSTDAFMTWLRLPPCDETGMSAGQPWPGLGDSGVLQVGVNAHGWVVIDWIPGP